MNEWQLQDEVKMIKQQEADIKYHDQRKEKLAADHEPPVLPIPVWTRVTFACPPFGYVRLGIIKRRHREYEEVKGKWIKGYTLLQAGFYWKGDRADAVKIVTEEQVRDERFIQFQVFRRCSQSICIWWES